MTQMTVAGFDKLVEAANARMDAEIAALREKKALLDDLLERRLRHAEQLEETLTRLKREQESMDAEVRRLLTEEEQALVFRQTSVAQ